MVKKRKKKQKKASLKKRLFHVFLFFILVFCLVSFFATSRQLAHERTQLALTGAVSADVAAHNFVTAALGLSLLLLVLAALILGIATYLIVQINKNNHIEFMTKQTFVDLFHKFGYLFKSR